MFVILLIVSVLEYFKYKKSISEKLARLNKEIHENSTDDLEKEVASLKERIQVLEAIVTDRRFDLERKIGNL